MADSDRPSADRTGVILPIALIAGLVVLLVLDPTPAPEEAPSVLEAWLKRGVGYVALGAEAGAAAVIAVAVLRGLWECLLMMARRLGAQMRATEHIRLRLGRLLVLGLEFTVAADILGTVVAPSRAALTVLAVVLLLRTFLSLILEREVRALEAQQSAFAEEVPEP